MAATMERRNKYADVENDLTEAVSNVVEKYRDDPDALAMGFACVIGNLDRIPEFSAIFHKILDGTHGEEHPY